MIYLQKNLIYKDNNWNDFFTTKFENKEIINEDNLYTELVNFEEKYTSVEHSSRKLKLDIKNCLYKNECYDFEAYKEKIEELNNKETNPISSIDKNKYKLIEKINKIKLAQYRLKKNINVLYNFENDTELDKIIWDFNQILSKKKYYKSDIYQDTFYTNNKKILANTLNEIINENLLENSIKNNNNISTIQLNNIHNWTQDYISNINNFASKFSWTTFFDYDKTITLQKYAFYEAIQNWSWECWDSNNNDINYLKSNLLWKLLANCYSSQYEKIEDLELLRKEIIEKLKK